MMNSYKNMKIKSKLNLGFSLMVLFSLIIGILGILSVQNASAETQSLNGRSNSAIESARLNENANAQRAAYHGASLYLVLGDVNLYQQEMAKLETLEQEFATTLSAMQSSLDDEQAIQYGQEIQQTYAVYQQDLTSLMAVLNNSDASTAQEGTDAEAEQVFNNTAVSADAVIAATDKLTDRLAEVTDEQAALAASNASGTTVLLIIVLVIAVALAAMSTLFISGIIATPLNMMMGFLKQVGESGSLHFTDDEWARTRAAMVYKDETSQSLAAFVKMLEQLVYYGEALEKVAQKDISFTVKTLGSQDTIGTALTQMTDGLNEMFDEINSIASQVATSSGEVATGSQTLAQGSTEQASTVEEISASINEITAQSKGSVETANNASAFSDSIRQIAQNGNAKMDNMMTAVREIDEASSAIGNVIKVIDDIAFQTNILALNAAVEAARAGEHGKGFAVVADEVRNLAGKSADAAKETSGLISTNMEKAKMGLDIAQDTAQSLQQIVEGIEQTSHSLTEIAEQSAANEAATEQVNQAIDQVAQVVQQNSATSEESAAASQQMSSQAHMLQSLVARFKLRSQGQSGLAPVYGPAAAPEAPALPPLMEQAAAGVIF